eukprot:SAG31_NODE_396_length_16264_cov_17.206496_10_plen_120_part_00
MAACRCWLPLLPRRTASSISSITQTELKANVKFMAAAAVVVGNWLMLGAGCGLILLAGADEGNLLGVEAENEVAYARGRRGFTILLVTALANLAALLHPASRPPVQRFWASCRACTSRY